MRAPITRRAPMRYTAVKQSQYKMPTNYDQVGRAWAAAALAQGRMGMAIADAGAKFVDAGLEIEYNNQKADVLTKKSEFKSWLAGYVTEQTMRQDLTEMGESGSYNYETIEDDLSSKLASFEKELNTSYKITNPQLRSAYMADRLGMIDAAKEELAQLRMRSHNNRIRGEADDSLAGIRTKDAYLEWEEAYSPYYSPEDISKKRRAAENQWNGESLRVLASESFDVDYLTGTSEGSHMYMIDQMYMSGAIDENTANRQRAVAKARVNEVVNYYKDQIANSTNPDMVEAWSTAAIEAGALNLNETDTLSLTTNSRNLTASVMANVTDANGNIVDSPFLLAEANSTLNSEFNKGTITPTDYKQEKGRLLSALEARSDEHLTAIAVGPGGYAAVEQAYKDIDTVDPREAGFAGSDDPYWQKYKESRKTTVAALKAKYEEKELEFTKDQLITHEAAGLAFGTMTVSNDKQYEAGGKKASASEVKEAAWKILMSMNGKGESIKPGNPIDTQTRLSEFVAKHKYVPEQFAEAIHNDLNSGDPQRIGAALALADQIDSAAGGGISASEGSAFRTAAYGQAFEMARDLFTTLDGINIATETGAQMYRDVMNNYLNRTQVPESVAEQRATDFLEKENFEEAVKKYGEGDDIFDAMEDKVVGSSEVTGLMKSVYATAIAAGKDHKNAARLAVSVARNTFSYNEKHGEIERDSIHHKHQFAGTEELEWSLRDFASGVDRLTEEDIANGYQVHPDDAFEGDQVRFQKLKDGGWLMVDMDGRPIIQRLQDKDGAVVPDSARLVIVRGDQLSKEPQEQVKTQNAQQAAKAADAVVDATQAQLEERLEVAQKSVPKKAHRTRRGTRFIADPDSLPPVESWQVELEKQVEASINNPDDPLRQEIGRLQTIVLQEARITGLSQETVISEMERIEKEVRAKHEANAEAYPADDDMDGDDGWEVDLKGQKTKGQVVEEDERVDASKEQIREMRKAAREKLHQQNLEVSP